MNIIGFAVLIILSFIIKKYVKLSMVIITVLLTGVIILVNVWMYIFIFSNKINIKLNIMIKIFMIFISILPLICIKDYIVHTFRILDYWINKNKLEEINCVEKGIIKEIKSYGFGKYNKDGHYLIVEFNGERICSIPFRYSRWETVVKKSHKRVYNNCNNNEEKEKKVLWENTQSYNIGDEIDIIVCNNKKYVKLKEWN